MGIWANGENFPFYGAWVGFEGTNGRGGVSRKKVKRELVKYNQGGLDMGAVEGPRSADDAPGCNIMAESTKISKKGHLHFSIIPKQIEL